jgi:hypothetical protein
MNIGSLYLLPFNDWHAFFTGMREFRSDVTTAYEDDEYGELAEIYDCGREFAHWITFRRFEGC